MVSIELLVQQQVVNGLLFGGQLALMAVGLTLIWGVARVLNFGHGAMFMVGGFVGYFTLGATGNIVVAVVSAALVVFALGYLTEVALIRPLRDREEFGIPSMVVTLGLAFFPLRTPSSSGSAHNANRSRDSPAWSGISAELQPGAQRVLIFVISLVALGLLFYVIARTKLGLGIRAVSQDNDTALLMGVRPNRIYAITFGISAALAGLAGVLLAPLLPSIHPSVGWYPFLLSFVVVMVGGLGSVRGTLLSAMGLAIIRSVSTIWVSSEMAMVILFGIMILILPCTQTESGVPRMTAIDTLRSGIARTAERLTEDARSRNGAAFVIAGVLGLLAPVLVGGYTLDLVMQLIILILVVTSWIFIAGYFGMFSFAHAALYGIGAYAALLAGEMGIHPIIAVLLGGVVAGILSIPIALPVLRLSGAYVGMVTLAFAEIVYRLVIVFREVTGGPTGYTGFPSLFGGNRIALYYFVFALVAALLVVRSTGCWSIASVSWRERYAKPRRSADAGNNVPRYKLTGFIIGSAIAGVAGGLQAHTVLIISPPMIEVNRMIEFMAMGIIGGLRTIGGGIFRSRDRLRTLEGLRDLGEVRLVIWGALLVVVTIYFGRRSLGVHLTRVNDSANCSIGSDRPVVDRTTTSRPGSYDAAVWINEHTTRNERHYDR